MTGFGPNEWLVDELYQAYLADPESVDKAWWDFFADYQPADMTLPRAVPPPAEAPGRRPGRSDGAAAACCTCPAGRTSGTDDHGARGQ